MKRTIILIASLALVAGGLHILPAAAAEAPEIPATVQIDDPVGDANLLNDQDTTGTPLSGQGDNNQAGKDVGSATDLMKIWFTNTSTDVSLHFQTEGDPTNLVYDSYFRFASNPGAGSAGTNEARGCLYWIASINGAAGGYTGETQGVLEDKCNVGDGVAGPLTTAPGPETTFISTMTFPRSYSPLLTDGGTLATPYGISRVVYAGPLPQAGTAAVVTMDNTKRGSDYVLVTGTPAEPAKPAKPAKPTKPVTPVKKGCDKGQGKKKGCSKTPPPAACAPFAPGEAGADKPTITLTDAATADKPVEQKVTLEQSTADFTPTDASYDYFNVVVDSAAASAGLYATFEFPTRRDYDLDLLHPDGSFAARSHGFNPIAEIYSLPPYQDREGHGGDSTDHSESLVGITTPDCAGWTVQATNWFGEGGEMTVKLWLGEGKIEPQAEGEETP